MNRRNGPARRYWKAMFSGVTISMVSSSCLKSAAMRQSSARVQEKSQVDGKNWGPSSPPQGRSPPMTSTASRQTTIIRRRRYRRKKVRRPEATERPPACRARRQFCYDFAFHPQISPPTGRILTLTLIGEPRSMTALQGKRALITGGATGIGLGIAQALGKAGCQVAISGRREDKLRKAAEAWQGTPKFLYHPSDVADRASVHALFQWAEKELGPIDILVCSAGMNIKNRTLSEMRPEQWDEVMAV